MQMTSESDMLKYILKRHTTTEKWHPSTQRLRGELPGGGRLEKTIRLHDPTLHETYKVNELKCTQTRTIHVLKCIPAVTGVTLLQLARVC